MPSNEDIKDALKDNEELICNAPVPETDLVCKLHPLTLPKLGGLQSYLLLRHLSRVHQIGTERTEIQN